MKANGNSVARRLVIRNKPAQHLILLRPRQWVKNLFVLAPVFFAGRIADAEAMWVSLLVLAAFSLVSGAIYALNDVLDREWDRSHPLKRGRPVASGAVSVPGALVVALAAGGAGCSSPGAPVPRRRWEATSSFTSPAACSSSTS